MIYMFLADGFEEVEALSPLDIIRRMGLEIKTVALKDKVVCGAHSIKVVADMTADEFRDDKPEMVILPGGMPGTLNLDKSEAVHKAISDTLKNDGYLCAICAAPMILGKLGLLAGKNAVCYPGFEKYLEGAKISDKKVVKDGKIITAKGMGAAVEFGLAIVKELCSDEKADELAFNIIAK